jgi:hypothetical protein
VILPVPVLEETDVMALARYEVRLNGVLSERARSAFCALDVALIPPQTIVFGDLAEVTDLADVLALCRAMGLEVVSLRRLPDAAAGAPGTAAPDDAGPGITADPGLPSTAGTPGTADSHGECGEKRPS